MRGAGLILRCKVALVALAVLAAAGASLSVGASPARADFVEPPQFQQPIWTHSDGELEIALQQATQRTDMADFEAAYTGADGNLAARGATRAAMASRVLPAVRVLGTIGLAVTAFEVGWKIGSSIYVHLLAPEAPQIGSNNVTDVVVANTSSDPDSPFASNFRNYACPGSECWLLRVRLFDPTGGTTTLNDFRWLSATATTGSGVGFAMAKYMADNIEDFAGQAGLQIMNNVATTGSGPGGAKTDSDYGVGCTGTCTGLLRMVAGTDDAIMDKMEARPMTPAQYNALPSPQKRTSSYTEPTHTSDDAAAARASLSHAVPDARTYINWLLDPGYDPGEGSPTYTPFAIPEPLPTETYSQYVGRLRDRGWLGTLTVEPADSLETAADPLSDYAEAPTHAPAGVLVAGNPIVWIYDEDATTPGNRPDPTWPDNPPHIPTPNTPVTIKEKPGDTLFPPVGGGGGTGDCPCDLDSIDFSPLTSVTSGDSFPFGVFGFVGDILGPFNISPITPEFDFTTHSVSVGGDSYGGGAHYDVSLENYDGYMDTIRLLISVALWIGVVIGLAYKLLGLGRGPDEGGFDASFDPPND